MDKHFSFFQPNFLKSKTGFLSNLQILEEKKFEPRFFFLPANFWGQLGRRIVVMQLPGESERREGMQKREKGRRRERG